MISIKLPEICKTIYASCHYLPFLNPQGSQGPWVSNSSHLISDEKEAERKEVISRDIKVSSTDYHLSLSSFSGRGKETSPMTCFSGSLCSWIVRLLYMLSGIWLIGRRPMAALWALLLSTGDFPKSVYTKKAALIPQLA